jgi:exopolysaccharide biosynthesis polyprenyl glycosylphosphotransferase
MPSVAAARRRRVARATEFTLVLFCGDVAGGALAAALAPVVWAELDRSFSPLPGMAIFQIGSAIAWPLLLRAFGGGRVAARNPEMRSLRAISQALVAGAGIVLVLFYFAPFFAPRGSTLLTLPLLALLTAVWRFTFLRIHEQAALVRTAVVLGTDDAALRAARALVESPGSMLRVAAIFAVEPSPMPVPGLRVVPLDDNLWEAIVQIAPDVLVVGHTRALPEPVLAELAQCYEHGMEAVPATTVYEELEGRVMASALEADWYAELPTATRGLYMIAKRAFDVAFALLFGILTLPLMALIALAIWRESGRPVILGQLRIGLRGEPFVIHKFRSMRLDAEAEGRPLWATPDDERVTRFGGFLRRTRLDELPQLWDVLRGKMSLIGPRPERPEFVERLARELPLYRARALVLPGITGWAQVQYPYAGTLEENLAKLEYDLYYIRHFGPQLDARIALRTALTIIRPAGR